MERKKTIVLGLGNKVLGDDGVAIHLISDMQKEIIREDVSFQTSALGGLEIIDFLKGYKRAVILDGIRTLNGKPGDLYFMDSNDFLETLHLSNIHDADFQTTLQVSNKLGVQMPEKISIIAIEIEEDRAFSESLTPVLRKKYNDILQLSIDSVNSVLND